MATITRFEEIDAWKTARELALDLSYINQEQFKQGFDLADKASRQIYNFMSYLEAHPQSRRAREEGSEYEV